MIAAQIAELLTGVGIRRVYGLPGEDHMALIDAFEAAGLEYVTAFNESSAVIMAATDAQHTGLPGVVVLSLAPGVSNGVNGLLNTYLDQVPLILISGQHPAHRYPFVTRQGFDIEQLVTPMTKWRARAVPGTDIPGLVGRAVDEAMSGKPGPVYLEVPDDVATADPVAPTEAVAAAVEQLRARWGAAPGRRPAVPAEVADLRSRLETAERPVLVLAGRRRRVSPETATAFAEAWRLPVFTSSRQKGTVHPDSPYAAGTFLNGRLERHLFDRSDLVVLVDPDPFDFYNRAWCFDSEAVAFVEDTFTDWSNPIARRLVGDPEASLAALADNPAPASVWTAEDVQGYRDHLRATLLPPTETLSVSQAVDAALAVWPRDGYLIADAGFSKPLVAMLSTPSEPDLYYASNALSTMGYTVPTAVATRRAVGGRPVLGFLGDGSLLMRATELMVSTEAGGPLVYVVVMDRALTQIEVKQERRHLRPVGATLPELSAAKLGEAFGIEGIDAHTADDVRAAVGKGLGSDRPVLVGVHVDKQPARELFEVLRG
ncbi:thiamine pyrophosphate-binding protein [Nocardioides halotolerans]|uniref:thiamine pyrophosphate-binding protein n=1 Tax=Nocardioides halotolerans TaxID=433660 RepID=UPI0004291BD3|nr:thiamine pyrophosphate-binding protein [Nocardioides halotolerans]